MFRRFRNFKSRKPVLFMVIGYAILWIICCAVLTELIGKRQFELYAQDYKDEVEYWFKIHLGDLQSEMLKEDFDLENKRTFMEMSFYNLPAALAYYTDGKMYTTGGMVAYDTNGAENSKDAIRYTVSLDDPQTVYLLMFNIQEGCIEYYSCPISCFNKVIEETYAIKGKSSVRWNYGLDNSWNIYPVDGYVKGHEFRPGKVEFYYTAYNDYGVYKDSEHKIIDCSGNDVPEGFIPMDMSNYNTGSSLFSPGIMFPGDGRNWINISAEEMFSKGTDRYGEKFLKLYNSTIQSFLTRDPFEYYSSLPSAGTRSPFDYDFEVVCPEYRLGSREYQDHNEYIIFRDKNKLSKDWASGIPIPFSFLNGDVIVTFKANLKALNGQEVYISFDCLIEDCLGAYRLKFFKDMLLIYFGAFIFFAILVIYAYKRFYSLQGKNRFHKALINSMAHDLKTPLMIMQGFSENLKENVHTEKREYYADNILENVNYLDSLIDKNLDFSKKKDFDTAAEESVCLSGILNNTVMRYKKKLDEKKLTVVRIGDTEMKGDPEILALVTDNLINNAIKYSFENTQIDVLGKYRYFVVKNKAELNYDKNLQNLLAPLEMADDARSAGKGTGLGLSIANGIIQERGGRIKLSYNKKTKTFTCKVIVRKILGLF
ncbi:MAG: HAMP domain-containing histidine kinase [Lachnospiraceae bacterium]|nr:HAMP domain-containing histidine kinase [Lachnospiraceae bacterium]